VLLSLTGGYAIYTFDALTKSTLSGLHKQRGDQAALSKQKLGKLFIAGMRLTVELIPEKLAGGKMVEQILEAHPQLTQKAIQKALVFAGGQRGGGVRILNVGNF